METFVALSNIKWLIIFLLCNIGIQNADGKDYCFYFDDEGLDGWGTSGINFWHWSNGSLSPNLTDIVDFNTTNIPDYYEWIQTICVGPYDLYYSYVQIDYGDIVSLKFYRQKIVSSVQFTLKFDPMKPTQDNVTIIDTDEKNGWQTVKIICSMEPLGRRCCDQYPCFGTIHITASTETESEELLAFGEFLVNGCPSPPPPVTESFCNTFDLSDNAWTLDGWTQGENNVTLDSTCAWSNINGAKLISPDIVVEKGSQINFTYYVAPTEHDIGNSLTVYFNDKNSSNFYQLGLYQNTSGSWMNGSVQCNSSTPCCADESCTGNIVWESLLAVGDIFIAVDNLQFNDGCESSAVCCKFESSDLCGYSVTGTSDSNTGWLWSGNDIPNPSITDDELDQFVRWKANTTLSVSSTLQSKLITIKPNSTVHLSVNGTIDANNAQLNVNFHSVIIDEIHQLDYVQNTNGWLDLSANCIGAHAKCCSVAEGCVGWIELTAIAITGAATFEVDDIQLDSECII
ncbi:hypothetical protein CHUAL_002248 [Chamberlinius hualienensis]